MPHLHRVRRVRRRTHARALLLGLGAAGVASLIVPAAGLAEPTVVYTSAPAANAIHDGAPGVPGVQDALRQGPIVPDPRWPTSRQMGKIDGTALSELPTAEAMAAALRLNASQYTAAGVVTQVGGGVGVDEITPAQWTADESVRLRDALRQLGPLESQVVFYASPALVAQVGRADARKPLPGALGPLVEALSTGGHLFLEGYTGNLVALSRADMSIYLTRFQQRFPESQRDRLHVLIGPSTGTSQADIWNRIRSTPAGREILANGPGAFGLDAADGAAWLAAYRVFLADPNASPPGGDFVVPTGGGVSVSLQSGPVRPGTDFRVEVGREGDVSVFLLSASGDRRGLASFDGPATRTISLPNAKRIEEGRYDLVVFVRGDGLTDRIVREIRIDRNAPRQGGGDQGGGDQGGGDQGGGGSGFTLSAGQLLINQRISQAAIRRLNAVQAWLDAGIGGGDIVGGGLAAGVFSASVVTGPVPAHPLEAAAPRPITPEAPGPRGGGNDVRVTVAQLRINQRISAAAVRRSNALDARLDQGLTGGDVLDGAITLGKLPDTLGIVSTTPAPAPPPSQTQVKPPSGERGQVTLSVGQLRINQRISQAAVRRANGLIDQLEDGVDASNILAGSITADDLVPTLR